MTENPYDELFAIEVLKCRILRLQDTIEWRNKRIRYLVTNAQTTNIDDEWLPEEDAKEVRDLTAANTKDGEVIAVWMERFRDAARAVHPKQEEGKG